MKTSSLTPANPRHNVDTLENVLAELEKYGLPSLIKSKRAGRGETYWWCSVSVFVNGEGVTFDVKQSGSATPLQAAQGARDKLHAAIKTINETGKLK